MRVVCAEGGTLMRWPESRPLVLLMTVSVHTSLAQDKPAAKNVKAVRFGKLWNGKGKVLTNAIVVIDATKFARITTDASAIPAGAETIDLSKYTGLPGLIDVHTHMTFLQPTKRPASRC